MTPKSPRISYRLELRDRTLAVLGLTAMASLVLYFSLFPLLPEEWKTPGSKPLYLAGVAAGTLMFVSMGFPFAKRTGRVGAPPTWLLVHVIAAMLGTLLAAIHSAGSLGRPPALLFLALLGLTVLGVWARTRVSRQVSATFATRHGNFRPAEPLVRERLGEMISKKTGLLGRLDPTADEGTFSPTLFHWCRHPLLTLAYARLAAVERRLIGARRTLPLVQAYWRRLHILLGLVFVLGLLIHVFTVTFFAKYVADGREIIWPHITEW